MPPGAKTAPLINAQMRQTIVLRLIELPQQLQQLNTATRIDGQVVSRNADQSVVVRTAQGDITMRDSGSPRLQPGDRVAMDIAAGSPPRQAALKGYAPVATPTQSQPTPNLPAPVPTKPDLSAPPPLSGKPVLNAPNILPQQPGQTPAYDNGVKLPIPMGQALRLTPAGNFPLPQLPVTTTQLPISQQGFMLQFGGSIGVQHGQIRPQSMLQILSGFVPQSSQAAPLATALPQGLAAAMPLNAIDGDDAIMLQRPVTPQTPVPAVPSSAARDMPVLQLGTLTTIPTSAFTGQNVPLLFSSNVQPGGLLVQVMGFTARQQPVLQFMPAHMMPPQMQAALGSNGGTTQPLYILHFPQGDVAIGDTMQLGMPLAESLSPDALKTRAAASLWWMPGAWDDMAQIITQSTPQLAQFLEGQLPRAGQGPQAFSGAAAFLLSVMQGNLGEFLDNGDQLLAALTAKSLTSSVRGGGLAGGDGAAARVSDSDGQSWRITPLPVMASQAQIDKVQLYVAEDQNRKRDRSTRDRALRFIMAAKLSRMGDMQLEGLYQEERKQLDLQVRSEQAFSSEAQGYIGKLYAKALNRSDLTGEVFFQLKRTSWHEFTAPMLAAETVLA